MALTHNSKEHGTMATKQTTRHAAAAKMIRRDLKTAFPHTTFRVRAKSYSGGSSVRIDWVDGPTQEQVNPYLARYEQCSFDGMRDLKEYTNTRTDVPQVDYVNTHREMSRDTTRAIVDALNARYGWDLKMVDAGHGGYKFENDVYEAPGYRSHRIWPTFSDRSMVCHGCLHEAEWADVFCAECGAKLQPAFS